MAYTICLLATIAVLVYFLTYGLMNVSRGQSYFNCDKQLNRKEFSSSFAASTTSLATVLYYFVILGLENGLWIIIFSPASFIIGTLLFSKLMLPRLVKQKYGYIEEGEKTIGNTLGDYIYQRYDSQLVKKVILVITLLGIISVMLIELYVGVQIFNVFMDSNYEIIALIFISIVTFIYTGLGGLNAVVKTDKIQFAFMMLTALILVLFLLFHYTDTLCNLSFDVYFPRFTGKDGIFHSNWALYLNTVCVNILLIPSLLRNWQLFAATKDDEISNGMWIGVFFTVLISLLFVLFGIYFYTIFAVPKDPSLNHILSTMANSGNAILSNFLFPMLFVACLMALLSTVDSSLLPIVQSLVMDTRLIKYKDEKYTNIKCIAVILFVTLFLYLIVFKLLNFDILNWLFTIFSLVTISSPAIIFACFGNKEVLKNKKMQNTVVWSTILGLIIAGGISLWGNKLGMLWLIQLNTPFAVAISSFIIFVVYIYTKNSIKNK
jgi:SSS family solute:Na+ symporter